MIALLQLFTSVSHEELAVCEDFDGVRSAMEKHLPYQAIFAKLSFGECQMLDKAFFEEFHYAVFFDYMRLREHEIRNLMGIAECVAQNQKARIHDGVVMIF